MQVQNKLEEVVSLSTMPLETYTDQVAHVVDLYRKRQEKQLSKDKDVVRQMNGQKVSIQAAMLTSGDPTQFALVPQKPQFAPAPPRYAQYIPSQGQQRPTGPPRLPQNYSGCFKCGDMTHIARDCPNWSRGPSQNQQQWQERPNQTQQQQDTRQWQAPAPQTQSRPQPQQQFQSQTRFQQPQQTEQVYSQDARMQQPNQPEWLSQDARGPVNPYRGPQPNGL